MRFACKMHFVFTYTLNIIKKKFKLDFTYTFLIV